MSGKTRSTDGPSIQMSNTVKLKVDWKTFTLKLTEAVAQGFLAAFTGDGISSGITALIEAAGTVKSEDEPGQKAWTLAMLCFAWTLDELTVLTAVDRSELKRDVESLMAEARERLHDEQDVPVTFLDRPTTLPLYRVLRDSTISRKDRFRSGINETDTVLRARFDAAFDRAVFEVFARKGDTFQSLVSLFASPGVRAAESQAGWSAYRRRLNFEFRVRPVFGQENSRISLSQVYVPLRGYWRKADFRLDIREEEIFETHEIGMLDDLLDDWLENSSDSDNIRLIGGGPGSGKSTTLRALADRYADRSDWRPLFISLQHVDLEGDFRESLNRYFTERTHGSFTQPPLARSSIEDGPPLLLIFDGLDELARPGEAANEVVNLFATRLSSLMSALRGEASKTVKAVVSGRMPSFQAAKRYISPPRQGCLEVYGFTPATQLTHAEDLWKIDQRVVWWSQYARLVRLSEQLPPAFTAEDLKGITHEPLLCYLLVLSGFATANWESAAENHNRIYKTLIDSVWQRGWGEGLDKRQGAGRSLTKADFNRLMQTISLAAWLGGDTRVASEAGFQCAIKITRSEDTWEIFKEANGPDVTNLAMNFYLKASEGSQRGFEFTHKSFGDYLAARAILDLAEELPVLINRKVDHALTDWLDATGTGEMTKEILAFLRDEVRLRTSDSEEVGAVEAVVALKVSFQTFVSTILHEGLPAASAGTSWRTSESRQRNAEIAAWAVLNSLALTLARWRPEEALVKLNWPDAKNSLFLLINRLTGPRDISNNVILSCFSYLDAPKAYLFGLSISSADFRGSNMPRAVFSGSHLIQANFHGANLERALFERAMLDRAVLDEANLRRAVLVDARMEGTTLVNTVLDNTFVSEITLLFVDLGWLNTVSSNLVISNLHYRPDRYVSLNNSRRWKQAISSIERRDEYPFPRDNEDEEVESA